MRRVGTWIILACALSLIGAAWAQSPDEAQNQVESDRAEPDRAEVDEAELDEDEGQAYQAPGVQLWLGRIPSEVEVQVALSQILAQPQDLSRRSDEPDFQNEHAIVYIGKLPTPETLRNMIRTAEQARKEPNGSGSDGEREKRNRELSD